MGNCFGYEDVKVPDAEVGRRVENGRVHIQTGSEACQTAPAISVWEETKDMRMLVFAKCITMEENSDLVRITVYYTDEDSPDPVKVGKGMEANKDAGKLVGQRPVYMHNNEQHVLVEIGDVILPSQVVRRHSKIKDLIPFKSIWRKHNGQSSTLLLQRANLKEKGVNFKVKFRQGNEVVLNIHVVQELRNLIMGQDRYSCVQYPLDSGVVTSSEGNGKPNSPPLAMSTSSSDQDYHAQGARPKSYNGQKPRKKEKRGQNRTSDSRKRRDCRDETDSEGSDETDGFPQRYRRGYTGYSPIPDKKSEHRSPDLSCSNQREKPVALLQRDNTGSLQPSVLGDDSGVFMESGPVAKVTYVTNHVTYTNVTNNQAREMENAKPFEMNRFPEILLEALGPLDLGDWKRLASHLRLDGSITYIETEVQNHSKCPTRLLLDIWWQDQGKKADIAVIKTALKEMHRRDVLEGLEDAEANWAGSEHKVMIEDLPQ